MKKKVVTLSLVVALIATAAIGGTLAYFTDSEEATNTFTVGNVDIVLDEPAWDEESAKLVVPGQTVAKDPVVKNVGDNAAWIRVDVTITEAAAFKAAAADKQITDLGDIFLNHNEDAWTRADIVDDANANTLTYQYYFNTAVAPNGDTGALFTAVKLPGAFDNADMEAIGDDFNIIVKAHAIQTSEDYSSAAEAFANYVPQEPTPDTK